VNKAQINRILPVSLLSLDVRETGRRRKLKITTLIQNEDTDLPQEVNYALEHIETDDVPLCLVGNTVHRYTSMFKVKVRPIYKRNISLLTAERQSLCQTYVFKSQPGGRGSFHACGTQEGSFPVQYTCLFDISGSTLRFKHSHPAPPPLHIKKTNLRLAPEQPRQLAVGCFSRNTKINKLSTLSS
jgi:hypothetical protein